MAGSIGAPSQPTHRQQSAEAQSVSLAGLLIWFQGGYYLFTGLWPLVSIRSFIWLTGEKTDHLVTGREADHWLVMTVGVLITAIAVALLVAAYRGRRSPEIITLAVAAALGLTAMDVVYVTRQVIAPIYLADAAIETVLIAAWGFALIAEPRQWRTAAQLDDLTLARSTLD